MAEKNRKTMLINVTHSEESRVAILKDGILESFEIETVDRRSTKGNIYKGRIENVHVGLQACFVDIGDERSGFLPLDEVNYKVHPSRKDGSRGRIENHLQRGQELLVQVVRDAYANKPPTLSTYFSLPGRFLVLTPQDDSTGVSRKLDDKQRERIKATLKTLPCPEGFGVIARTAGAQATKPEMARDFKYLLRLWEKIEDASKLKAPRLIYQERSLVIRAIRDLYSPDLDEILVDDPDTHVEIVQFFEAVLPHKKKVVKFYQGERPIFNKHNLEEQIENIFRRRVLLPSGGAVVFDTTEALTAVDVNSGRMKQEGHIEETATKANLEAAEEIGRQLRLRDLGGLIVIDFIDMRHAKNIRAVEKRMKDALKLDKARYDATRISRLGLMEISRQRLNPNKTSLRYTDCPSCGGTGSIKTIEAAALQALRRLQTRVVRGDLETVEIELPEDVANYVLNQKRRDLTEWENRYGTTITVIGDEELGRDECEMSTVARPRSAESRPVLDAPIHSEILAEIEEEPDEPEETGEDEGAEEGTTKKRRRRRRRRKKKTDDGSGDEAEATESDEAGETGEDEAGEADASSEEGSDEGEAPTKKRRRRRRRRKTTPSTGEDASDEESPAEDAEDAEESEAELEAADAEPTEAAEDGADETGDAEGADEGSEEAPTKKRRRRRRRRKKKPREEGGEEGAEPESGTDGEPEPAPARLDPPLAAPVAAPVIQNGDQPPRPAWWRQLLAAE